ncbi:MAG TPA: ATP-binding protein [Phycisphaerae bacterium]|nr:ATP-binding protein [Phycisphaerae bacterium]
MPRWHLLYFLLAGFDILTVSLSLSMTHALKSNYVEAVRTNEVWAQRIASYADLAHLATEVNAPGNDVFQTNDPDASESTLNIKLAEFNRLLADARRDLQENVAPAMAIPLAAELDAADQAMRNQVAESRAILRHIRDHELRSAGNRMAAMDKAYYGVNRALASATSEIREIQRQNFADQAKAAGTIERLEYVIGGAIVMMVCFVTIYGHRVSRGVKAAQERLEDYAVRLESASRGAEAASRAKSAFLANMSHEIRTPMTAILGFADVMIEPSATESDKLDAAQTIRRNGGHLLTLINDILDLSKIESGKMELERAPVSPHRLVREVVELLNARAVDRSVRLKVEFIGEIPETIVSDSTRLRQCLLNLAGNGVKFSHEGGDVRIHVECDRASSLIRFRVIDRGIGMSPSQMERLFKPFTQADESMTRLYGGTGLGLTITKQLAELMGGGVSVESELGTGSEFTLSVSTGSLDGVQMLVAGSLSSAGRAKRDIDAELPRLAGRVLLVEDGIDNQRLISRMLKQAGAEVDVVGNGRLGVDRALAAWDKGAPYGVILMDMPMPVMDGYEAARELRGRAYGGQIIALSAHAMRGELEKCVDAGCDHYLSKPIPRDVLIREVSGRMVHHAETSVNIR